MHNVIVHHLHAMRSLRLRLSALWLASTVWFALVLVFTMGHMLLARHLSAYDVSLFLPTLLILPVVLMLKPRKARPARASQHN
jgi:hypothetical protein